jgi:hypothetical protein
MVIVNFLDDGISLEKHCQNSKACTSLTVVFNLFIELFQNDIILETDIKKNYYKISTKNKKIVYLIKKYISHLSTIWTNNEIKINNKSFKDQNQLFLKNNQKINF